MWLLFFAFFFFSFEIDKDCITTISMMKTRIHRISKLFVHMLKCEDCKKDNCELWINFEKRRRIWKWNMIYGEPADGRSRKTRGKSMQKKNHTVQMDRRGMALVVTKIHWEKISHTHTQNKNKKIKLKFFSKTQKSLRRGRNYIRGKKKTNKQTINMYISKK